MVAILTTKKTKPIVVESRYYLVLCSLVWRNFAADLFAEKYNNQSIEGNRIQSNTIEHNRKAIERNRTQSNFPKFSIFDCFRLIR